MSKFINPFTDYGFKLIFGQEVNKDLLIAFLNGLFEGEKVITDLIFLDKELIPDKAEERRLIYDVYCKTAEGEYIIVEMQNKLQTHFKERALYYTTGGIFRQGIRGEWDFDVKAVYGIFFMNFRMPGLSGKFRTDVVLTDKDTGEVFSDKLRQIYLCLPEFKKTEESCHTKFDCWIYVLKNMETLERMPFKAREAVLAKLEAIATVAAKSQEDYFKYQDSLNAYRTELNVYDAAIAEGREQGLAQGLSQGLSQGRVQGLAQGRAEGMAKGIVEGMEKGIAEGMEKGLAKGRGEGALQEKLEMAGKMMGLGMSVEEVSAITGLTVEAIRMMM
jgi:predicted transposase/invertase (TIGR01784 family)